MRFRKLGLRDAGLDGFVGLALGLNVLLYILTSGSLALVGETDSTGDVRSTSLGRDLSDCNSRLT